MMKRKHNIFDRRVEKQTRQKIGLIGGVLKSVEQENKWEGKERKRDRSK